MRSSLGLLALLACGDDTVRESGTRVVEVAVVPAERVNRLDLLFQIDNSDGTLEIQSNLGRAARDLVTQLAVDGALPELHVGVVTSDLGTSGSADPQNPGPAIGVIGQGGCGGQGDDGMFVANPAVRGSFLVDEPATRNYDGALADVLEQMLLVGAGGCGFEQPLAATRRALQRDDGFQRSDAVLAVVTLADEDDCSIADAALLDAARTELGPLQSFRCTRYGVSCSEPLDELGEKSECRPWSESPYVEDPQTTVDFLRDQQPRQELLVVGAIVGPPAPFEVTERTVDGTSSPALAPSCTFAGAAGMEQADPAVRLASVVGSFGSRGALTDACSADLRPQVAQIGLAIKRALGVACIDTSTLADALPAAGIQPACEVHDVVGEPPSAIAIPRCPAEGDCYELVADPVRCPETADHARVEIVRSTAPPPGTRVEVRCEAPI